jgi:hypothetical protein
LFILYCQSKMYLFLNSVTSCKIFKIFFEIFHFSIKAQFIYLVHIVHYCDYFLNIKLIVFAVLRIRITNKNCAGQEEQKDKCPYKPTGGEVKQFHHHINQKPWREERAPQDDDYQTSQTNFSHSAPHTDFPHRTPTT